MTTVTALPTARRPAPAVRRRTHGTGALVTAAGTLVVAVGLWLDGQGAADLVGGAAPALTSLGRLTGLVSSDLLLLQVLAMARVPWAERSFGQDRLARWHRVLGLTSFTLLLAHIGLVTLGYAAAAGTGVLAQLWDLVASYPGMLLAAAGTALLALVVVTSVRAARRRLRYESWHLLHLYAYLGVGLALPHQLWTGTDFATAPLARAYWWGLYLLALGAVLVFRVGVPVVRNVRHRLVVAQVVAEAPGVVSVHLRGRNLHQLPARAGQFFVWRFLDGAGWSRGHPYSLSAAPHPDLLRITVRDLGDGSGRLAQVQPGTRVLVEGPYGALTADRRAHPAARTTLIAAGIGITPLRALLEELPDGSATLLDRAGDPSEVVLRAEIDALAAARGHRVVYLLGPRAADGSWLPRDLPRDLPHDLPRGDDASALLRLAPDVRDSEVFVCGPPVWTDAVLDAVRQAGVPDAQVHLELFAY